MTLKQSAASDYAQPLRIALVMTSNFGVADGGRETWAYNFIPRLLAHWPGLSIDIVGLNRTGEADNGWRLKKLLGSRGSVTFLHSSRKRFVVLSMLRQAPRLLSNAVGPKPDIVIGVGSVVELLVIRAAGAFRGARKIVWLRTILVDEKARRLPRWLGHIVRAFEIPLLRTSDLLIANGEDTAKYYRAQGLPVTVIANGVDVDRWRCPAPIFARPIRVILVGRFMPEKGLFEYFALARILSDRKQFEFHVVGDGPCQAMVDEAAADGLIVSHGSMPNSELPSLIASMDVSMGLSFHSRDGGGGGVSNALLEQMAAGRVIVAWQNEIYDQLLDGTNAYLVPQGDVIALKGTLTALAEQSDQARIRARAAQKTAERFSFDVHMDKFSAVIAPLRGG